MRNTAEALQSAQLPLITQPISVDPSPPLSFMTFLPRPESEIQTPRHGSSAQCLCSQLHPSEKHSLGKSFHFYSVMSRRPWANQLGSTCMLPLLGPSWVKSGRALPNATGAMPPLGKPHPQLLRLSIKAQDIEAHRV